MQLAVNQTNTNFLRLFFGALLALIVTLVLLTIVYQNAVTHSTTSSYVDASISTETIVDLGNEIFVSGKVAENLVDLPLESAQIDKLTNELQRIMDKTYPCNDCLVYLLLSRENGNYPILSYGNVISGVVYLKISEVWKVGQTCNCEQSRYPNDIYYKDKNFMLDGERLQFLPVFEGTQKEVLLIEKLLIYTYPFWSGHPELIKPAGCRIFR